MEQQQQQETAGGCSREGREEGGSAVVAQEESHKISVCGSVLEAQQRMPWLRIVIPTISRQQEMDYLTPTIQALHTETARSSLYSDPSNVQIVVINHNLPPLRHEAFERLKQHPTLGARSSWNLVRFVESRPKTRNTKNRLLQQTNDFLWTLKYMLQQQQQQQNSVDAGNRQKEEETREKKLAESYVLLMEDDFTLCPHGLRSLHYMIDKVCQCVRCIPCLNVLIISYFCAKSTSYFPNWIGLRVSYGLNGVVIKSSDLPDLIQFYESVIREHTQRGKKLEPPDHLIYRYLHTMQQDNRQKIGARQLVAYRYNLFRHIGVSSTFTGRYTRYNPECYQVLYDWLQPYERFRNEDCPNDDISPCQPQQEQKSEPAIESFTHSLIDWDVKATQLCRLHFPLCAEKSGITTQEQALAHGCRLRNDRQ